MTKTPAPDPLDSAEHIGSDDYDGPVALRRLPDGRALLLPHAGGGRQLHSDALDVLADMQTTVRRLQSQRTALDVLVDQARQVGVAWHLIGFSVGTTGEAARQRWGS